MCERNGEGPASAPGGAAPRRPPAHDVRHAMRHLTTAWMFGAAWLYITTGAALTKYARSLGLPDFWFGVLAAVPFAGALFQLPASFVLARYGHRKGLMLASGITHRLVWVLIAAIPWVLPGAWWWPGLLVLTMLSSVAGHVCSPAVLSWFADLIPDRIRGRYFSRRGQIGQGVALGVTLAAGYALDLAEPGGAETLRRCVSGAFALAGVLGVLDFLWLAPVPEVAHQPDPEISLWELFREPLRDRSFRHFLGFTATLTFALGYIGQFIWLYLFDVVGMSNTQANLMLVAVPLLVLMGVTRPWGRVIDRFGCRPTLVIAGLGIVPGAAAWVFVTPEHWWLGYVAVLLAVAAWPGVDLANFNILLRMSESGDGERQGSAYVAVNSVVVAGAGVASGLFGGLVAKVLGGWRGMLLGWPLTYHGVLFLLSAALRLAALAWLVGLREPEARTTRDTVRYVVGTMFSNVQQAIFMPVRRLMRLGRLAYRLTRRRRDTRPPVDRGS